MKKEFVETYERDSLHESRIIRQLALEWVQAHLPAKELTFVDCLNIMANLQATTRNVDQTTTIFEIAFNQACELKKSSEWLATELQFETLALRVPSRTVLVLLYLEHGDGIVDDDALDLYNERVDRFNDTSCRPNPTGAD